MNSNVLPFVLVLGEGESDIKVLLLIILTLQEQ